MLKANMVKHEAMDVYLLSYYILVGCIYFLGLNFEL